MPLNDDPKALPDEDYWTLFDDWKVQHPDEPHKIPADQYEMFPEEPNA